MRISFMIGHISQDPLRVFVCTIKCLIMRTSYFIRASNIKQFQLGRQVGLRKLMWLRFGKHKLKSLLSWLVG